MATTRSTYERIVARSVERARAKALGVPYVPRGVGRLLDAIVARALRRGGDLARRYAYDLRRPGVPREVERVFTIAPEAEARALAIFADLLVSMYTRKDGMGHGV